MLDYYPIKKLRTTDKLVKMNYENQCLFIKGPVKTEGTVMDDIDKEDAEKKDADKEGRREAMENRKKQSR